MTSDRTDPVAKNSADRLDALAAAVRPEEDRRRGRRREPTRSRAVALAAAGAGLIGLVWAFRTDLPAWAGLCAPPRRIATRPMSPGWTCPGQTAERLPMEQVRRWESKALAAEARRDLPAAVAWYQRILDHALADPELSLRAADLLERARRERDLLTAWQMRIDAGDPDAPKPTSLETIFDD